MGARVQNIRDFPQTKHGDPQFLYYKFNEDNKWKKNWQKSMATFLVYEINAADRDVSGPTKQVQIMFPLKDKNIN